MSSPPPARRRFAPVLETPFMKKFLVATATSVALVAAPIAIGGSVASAAPYAGTVKTKAAAKAPKTIAKKKAGHVTVRVTAAGNAQPKGRVTIRIVRKPQGATKPITQSFRYGGTAVKRSLKAIKRPGRYVITVSFKPAKDSVFKASTTKVVVRKR